jgi:uncharacterized protein involved in outer membrane biogenesis
MKPVRNKLNEYSTKKSKNPVKKSRISNGMKKLIIALALIAALMFVVNQTKNKIARPLLITGIKTTTGLRTEIDKIEISILRSSINLEEVMLYNPVGYPEDIVAEIPRLYVNIRPVSLLRGTPHFNEIRLDLKKLVVLKKEDGRLNLEKLNIARKTTEEKPASKNGKLQIDMLHLRIGQVIYKDYSKTPPEVRTFNINLDQKFENIEDVRDLLQLILARAVFGTAIADLFRLDVGSLKGGLEQTLGAALKSLKEGAKKILDPGGEPEEEIKDK